MAGRKSPPRGLRYGPKASPTEAFSMAFDLPALRSACQPGDTDLVVRVEAKLDAVIRAMPDWAAFGTVLACVALAARIRELRPDDAPDDVDAVLAVITDTEVHERLHQFLADNDMACPQHPEMGAQG